MIMSQAESKRSAGRSVRRIIPEAKRMGTSGPGFPPGPRGNDSCTVHVGNHHCPSCRCRPASSILIIPGFRLNPCRNDKRGVFHLKRNTFFLTMNYKLISLFTIHYSHFSYAVPWDNYQLVFSLEQCFLFII